MTHLLDTSAWLAHLFGEAGVDEVTSLFDDPDTQVSISALSIPELFARLKAIGRPTEWPNVWGTYSALFARVIPADIEIAHQAVRLRATTPGRLPTIDGLIAATAVNRKLTLVHRDPHLSAIADPSLRQVQLPAK
jgi:predicted nucleic acid-binding protein